MAQVSKMARGSIVNKWMLEFSICDLKDDKLVTKMLSVFSPVLEGDLMLKKIVLLRGIESHVAEYSVSGKILDALEIVFELDRKAGFQVLESMKTAYCSVAIDCVARFAKSTSEADVYFDAVKRIWRKRIGRLRKHNVDLFSEHLEIWMDTIETAVWDGNLRGKFFDRNTRYEALVAVNKYLIEAWETVGPKFSSSTLGKSLFKAQLPCLQKFSETNNDKAIKSFSTPQGFGDSSNPTAQLDGETLKGPQDPSSLVSSPLLKNKDRGHLTNIAAQSPNDNIHEEGSTATRLEVIGIPKEKNLLQPSCGLPQARVKNIEHVTDKGNVVEEEALLVPDMRNNNRFDLDDLVEGGCTNVVKEHVTDLPSSDPHGNLQCPDNLEANREAKRKVRVRRKHVGGPIKMSKRVRINDSDEIDPEGSNIQHIPLSEVEVIKIHQEFKSSSRELQDVVKDPLPDALHVAEAVLSNLSRKFVPQGTLATSIPDVETLKSHDVNIEKGNDRASTSYNNNDRTTSIVGNTVNSKTKQAYATDPVDAPNNGSYPIANGNGNNNLQNESLGHENRQRKANLWERNASTRTFEWDDSVDGSPEANFRLPTPKNCVNSPLKRFEYQKFARRRQIKKWSVLEEDTLREGVKRFGRGNWKMILNAYRDTFEERTEVDLKDKWRRMTS